MNAHIAENVVAAAESKWPGTIECDECGLKEPAVMRTDDEEDSDP